VYKGGVLNFQPHQSEFNYTFVPNQAENPNPMELVPKRLFSSSAVLAWRPGVGLQTCSDAAQSVCECRVDMGYLSKSSWRRG